MVIISLELFVIALMPLNYILRKYKGSCRFSKSQNQLMYVNDIKIFVRELEIYKVLKIFRQDIGIEFEIEKCAMLIMKKEKENSKRNRITNSGKHQNTLDCLVFMAYQPS